MSTKTVSYTLDTLPPLTEKQRQHLDALASRPDDQTDLADICLLYTSPSPRDRTRSRMPSSA